MMNTKRIVCDLALKDCIPLASPLRDQLTQLRYVLLDTSNKVNLTQFTQSAASAKQHMQLVTSSSALMGALVIKLTMLEVSPQAASIPPPGAGDTRNHVSAQSAYQCLTNLLFASSASFSRWPETWPVSDFAQYTPARAALHSVLVFLHTYANKCDSLLWGYLHQKPLRLNHTADSILWVPLAYITSITTWPGSDARMVEEVGALPSEFFSLACCLLLDHPEGQAVVEAPARTQPSSLPLTPAHKNRIPSIMVLGQNLDHVMRSIVRHNTSELVRGVITPAVISLFKYIIIVSSTRKHDLVTAFSDSLVHFLAKFLQKSNEWNQTAALEPSLDVFLQKMGPNNDHLLPKNIPTMPVSDVELLRVLFDQMTASPDDVQRRYTLVAAILAGWRDDTEQVVCFPSPAAREQIRGVYLVAHHCMLACKSWMQHQQHIKQNLRSSLCCPRSQHAFTEELQQVMALVFSNIHLRKSLAEVEHAHGESNQRLWKHAVWCCAWTWTIV